MAKFDLHANPNGPGYLIDCQSDLMSGLNTRFVVPLLPPNLAPRPAGRLNPLFDVDGDVHVMVTQFAGSVEAHVLGRPVQSLAHEDGAIGNAIDMLLFGF